MKIYINTKLKLTGRLAFSKFGEFVKEIFSYYCIYYRKSIRTVSLLIKRDKDHLVSRGYTKMHITIYFVKLRAT